jgi:O-antigen/teichoic acid export membrane protein
MVAPESSAEPQDVAAQHIRGSSLLLVGRLIALAIDFGAQVLLVRYLSKADFGAWSYALALVAMLGGIALFEMGNTLARFIPMYRERGQHGSMAGAVALGFAVVGGFGTLIATAVVIVVGILGFRPTSDPQALQLLILVAFLIPVQALDSLFTTLFATLGSSRAIFLRQAILGPTLRIALVGALVAAKADLEFLGRGYVAISLFALAVSGLMFWRAMRQRQQTGMSERRVWSIPARDLFTFATPLLASTLVWLLMESSDAVLLGYFFDTGAVASFRAVLPLARMNTLVILTFGVLYLPMASRLYARGDEGQLHELYWQSALWMTVLTFPIFLLTFSFARSTTVGLYGPAYAGSAPIMLLLAVGYFFHTALGFNGVTLRIYNKLRYTVSIDIAMAVLNVAVNLILIPRFGVIGAAIGTTATLCLHNVLKQLGLWRYTGWPLFRIKYALFYGGLAVVALALLGLQALLPASLLVALPLAAVVSLLALWISRGLLEVDLLFPEARRLPLVGKLMRRDDRAAAKP